jgi:hypothetical protein
MVEPRDKPPGQEDAPTRREPFPTRDSALSTEARSRPTSAPAVADPKRFLLGDPRRPLSLAVALVLSIVSFPVLWGLVLFMWAAADGDPTGNTEQGLVWLAGVPVVIALLAASAGWIRARRSYPPDARRKLLGPEGVLSAAAVLAAFAAVIPFGVWAWGFNL